MNDGRRGIIHFFKDCVEARRPVCTTPFVTLSVRAVRRKFRKRHMAGIHKMIDEKTMRSMLEGMESAAEEALRGDTSFYETLRSLQAEIDRDPRVRSAVSELDATGNRVFSSMTPRVKIRVRTSAGEISLPERNRTVANSSAPVAHLTQELRSAACGVIMRGGYREVLDRIMNDAVGSNARFAGIAAVIEKAGHEIVICLDLSAYAQVREPGQAFAKTRKLLPSGEPLAHLLSGKDVEFLKALKISAN
jgi:hypothetical protein